MRKSKIKYNSLNCRLVKKTKRQFLLSLFQLAYFQWCIMEYLLEFLDKHLVVGKTVFFRNIKYGIICCKQVCISVFQAYAGKKE
ncbi:hypothetical protein ADH70_023420 [Blautia pseudococcoides]|uniref:Uncharacterized protein n=1 Tax=Blautia pseudococcoides TaxID=1796616 RepID=A0A1C7I4H5_9FIRM|nr:hypothetical protein A4V09_01040 [Blautia pseudococcoides]ASU31465.1 hypothetical protein ADH70_023420 [Blautia pseudococcoides]